MAKNNAKGILALTTDGAAQIAEKYPLDDEDQEAAEDQVVQHRMRGHPDQRAAIVIGHDLDARRQAAVGIELFDLRLTFGMISLVCWVRPITTMAAAISSS